MPEQTSISIAIGPYLLGTFLLFKTNAPKNYDYDYTREIYSGGDIRYVIIPSDRAEYQCGRYRSSLINWVEPSEDYSANDLADKLTEALWRGLSTEQE